MTDARLPLALLCANAPAQDYYGEDPSKAITFWKNMGRLRRLNGAVETGVKLYSEGTTPRIFMQEESRRHLWTMDSGIFEFALPEDQSGYYAVIDAAGRTIASGFHPCSGSRTPLDLSEAAPGIYALAIAGFGVRKLTVVR